jgi:hypothetical protein
MSVLLDFQLNRYISLSFFRYMVRYIMCFHITGGWWLETRSLVQAN